MAPQCAAARAPGADASRSRRRTRRSHADRVAGLFALALLLHAPLLALSTGEPEDPWPKMLGNEKKARPSSVMPYEDMALDRDPRIQVPCLSARLCECSAQGGWNRTYWLNTASTLYQGQVYLAILQRVTMYRAKITYQQTKQTRRNQVMEVNHLLFCKADLLSRKVRAYDCKLVEPQAEYRERHPFPTHQHFNLVGLIDPRLANAGDEDGLYLQVGCRPKVLADLHEITKFRETPCLIKLLEGSKSSSGGGRPAVEEGGATATSHLRQLISQDHEQQQEQQPSALLLPLGQRSTLAAHRRLLEGDSKSKGEEQAAAVAAAPGGKQAPADDNKKAEEGKKAEQHPAVQLPGQQQQRQAQEQQQQKQQPQQQQQEAGTSTMVDPNALQILSVGMRDVTKDWPVMHLNPIAYTSGEQFPCEKNWVPFQYKGRLLWSRHLSPQEILTVHANGTATTLFRNENSHVFKPLAATCGKGPRGNTPAVRLSKETSGLKSDYYLGILHWTPQRGVVGYDTMERQCHEYLNFFFLMEAEPPFNLIEVARPPIPLVAATNPIYEAWPLRFGMGYISFPTGMVVTQGKVVITYGTGDRNVRVWRAALRDVLLTFGDSIASQLEGVETAVAGAA